MRNVPLAALLSIASLAALADPLAEGTKEQVLETKPRDGVYHRSILTRSPAATKEKWVVFIYPGYPGIMRIEQKEGTISYAMQGNFAVRSRRFLVNDDVATVTLDCPSDEYAYCMDGYRGSKRQTTDFLAQVEAVKAVLGKDVKIAVLGNSYGTVTSEVLAVEAPAGSIDAAIHTASFSRSGPNVALPIHYVDLKKSTARQLFVHHREDPCEWTVYEVLKKKYGSDYPFITVEGVENPTGEACSAYAQHGFAGREKKTMEAIRGWLLTNTVTDVK